MTSPSEGAPVAVALVATAAAYQVGWRALGAGGRASRATPAWRRWAFLAGVGVVAIALLPPVATEAHDRLSVHMVQHLLLTLIAAPLLVAGRPVLVAVAALPEGRRRRLLRLGRLPVVAVLGHPLVAWLLFAAVGWVVHFSPLFDLAQANPVAHAAEHALFLGSALLFWRPVLGTAVHGRLSHPLRLLYLAVAMPQNTFLALAISSSTRPLYDHYVEVARASGSSPLDDQRLAGGIMWVGGDLTLLAAVVGVAWAWAVHEERVTRRRELLEDLSEEAAGRPPSPRTAG
ncbi:MAG TPA: cytochrome c oxidase assembly protein [Acidimicrobiales bacterium]|nr:cytochrome c oxidase assembly protein [Acidimicrobiales bacterium]